MTGMSYIVCSVWGVETNIRYIKAMLKQIYKEKIVPTMQEKFGYKNVYAVPRLDKIVVNSGVGKTINARKGKETTQSDEDLIKDLISEFALIVGQRPHIIRARKSIAGFKLREGMISGVRATLRGDKMYDFFIAPCKYSFSQNQRLSWFRG